MRPSPKGHSEDLKVETEEGVYIDFIIKLPTINILYNISTQQKPPKRWLLLCQC
jgi:hypothetical protein